MKISIVTICLNNAAGLRKTAASIVTQEDCEYEWIVIDGGSTDDSIHVIYDYEKYITYWVSEKDKGIYHAMNKGIYRSTGDYILFLNAGDALVDDKVLHQALTYLNGKDLYVGDVCHFNENSMTPGYELPQSVSHHYLVYQLTHFTLPHPASFFRRDFFDRFGYYDESLKIVSDWKLFFTSIIMSNAEVESIPLITTIFDTNGISSTSPHEKIERENALYEFPMIEELRRFYVSNYEIVSAVHATFLGRMLIRIYFFIYRFFLSKFER